MPRYEIKKLFSSRFWEIALDQDRFTITEGKVGKPGKSRTQTFADHDAALLAYNQETRAKADAGYTHVSFDPRPIFPKRKFVIAREKEQPQVTPKEAIFAEENPALERTIFDDREDVAAWQVFGDWLEAQGDPRGKAIGLSFGGPEAEQALDEHIATYAASWLGPFYKWYAEGYGVPRGHGPKVMAEWRHGFLHHARLAGSYHGEEMSCAPVLESLLSAPIARFLHSLTIGLYIFDDENDYSGLGAILEGQLPMLRRLHVGDCEFEESMISATYIPDVDHLLRALPSLHELVVTGWMTASSLAHAELRSLVLESGGIGREMSAVVGAANFPKLERLEFWPGQQDYGGYGPLTDYAPLLSGATCPKLRHLGFRNSEQADEFVNVLAESALLPRLRTVDLSKSALTPQGARNLIAHKAKYAHLERLDVSECCLGEDVVSELARHFQADVLIADKQREPISFAQWDAALLRADEQEARYELHCYTDVGE